MQAVVSAQDEECPQLDKSNVKADQAESLPALDAVPASGAVDKRVLDVGAQEVIDGDKPKPPAKSERVQSLDDSVKADLNIYAERQAAIAARLANLTASLRRFEIKEKEGKKQMAEFRAEVKEWYRNSTGEFSMSSSKVLGKCHILQVPADVMAHVLKHLPGRKIFQACCSCRLFGEAQDAQEFWSERILKDFNEPPPAQTEAPSTKFERASTGGSQRAVKEMKEVYRDRVQRWDAVVAQMAWLKSKDYPQDVNGTMTGPWSRKSLLLALTDMVAFTGPTGGQWRKEAVIGNFRCLCALLGSSHEGVQELACAGIANTVGGIGEGGMGGKAALVRHNAVRGLQKMLFSNCLGIQKQASRAMVNGCIDLACQVTEGTDAALMHLPWRRDEVLTNGRAEWICVDFTPSGEQGQPFQVVLSLTAEGRMSGHGTDSMGPFELHEATLNRTLQWMSGSCVERSESGGAGAVNSSYEALVLGKMALEGAGRADLLQIAGNSTPKELPSIVDRMQRGGGGASLGFGEVVSRVAGFQARYNARHEGKVLPVAQGTEHIVFHKTYERRHGDDHVRLVAFADKQGYWGVWERGRYQYQNKMEHATRGVFRMWQP